MSAGDPTDIVDRLVEGSSSQQPTLAARSCYLNLDGTGYLELKVHKNRIKEVCLKYQKGFIRQECVPILPKCYRENSTN